MFLVCFSFLVARRCVRLSETNTSCRSIYRSLPVHCGEIIYFKVDYSPLLNCYINASQKDAGRWNGMFCAHDDRPGKLTVRYY